MIRRSHAALGVLLLLAVACRPVAGTPPAAEVSKDSTLESAAVTATVSMGRFTGMTFDKCSAPTTSQMTAWLASPYRGVGIYLGGRNAACPPANVPHLGAGWVQTVTNQGWRLLPLWVGRQAPCSDDYPAAKLISTNLFSAALQGIEEANDAAAAATTFGIASASPYTFGSPIYFDLEFYQRPNGICSAAVRTFVSWWVTRLHELGYRAGFYSSGSAGIADEVDVVVGGLSYEVPDELWFAAWNGIASAYGSQYVPDVLWYCHRHHQYLGGTNPNGTPRTETYGGVTLNIDSSASDGGVAQRVVGSSARTQAWPPFSTKCRL